MAQIDPEAVPVTKDINLQRMLESFLINLNMFTPEQRERMIKILEYVILPRYEMAGKTPIEEEYLKTKHT